MACPSRRPGSAAADCDLPGAATTGRPRRDGAGGLPAIWAAVVPAGAAETEFRADAVARVVDGLALGVVRRPVFLGATCGPGAGPAPRPARRREGFFRPPPLDAVTR